MGSSWKCPVDSSTEELLFDRLNLGEPRASRDLSFLDRLAGLDDDSAKPRTNQSTARAVNEDSAEPRRIEATATAVVRKDSARWPRHIWSIGSDEV